MLRHYVLSAREEVKCKLEIIALLGYDYYD